MARVRTVMTARWWGLPRSDLMLLLPFMPGTAAVPDHDDGWSGALAHWGVATAPASSADLVVSTPRAACSAPRHRPLVLARGVDRLRRLRRADYAVITYRMCWLSWDVVAAAPDRRGLAMARRTWASGGHPERGLRGLLLRLRPRPVTVAARGEDVVPAPLVAPALSAVGLETGGTFAVAVDVRDHRRRAVWLLDGERHQQSRAVVKVARTPGREDRASREQRVLSLLPPGGVTPRPLGAGWVGPIAWSAETAVSGRPLHQVLSRSTTRAHDLLDQLADWLGDVALLTATSVDWELTGTGDRVVSLRGPAARLSSVLPSLHSVPSVLAHGDLASGHNVLVDAAGRPAVIDWETARERGLPLLDLVPLLCWSLARVSGAQGPERQATRIIELAKGRSSDSDWLFSRVACYVRRLGLPPDTLGPLALLAWGHQASMRLVRDELLAEAGLAVEPWTSVGELVFEAWCDEFGTGWSGPLDHLP